MSALSRDNKKGLGGGRPKHADGPDHTAGRTDQQTLGNAALQERLAGGETPATVPRGGCEHTVVRGDTLWAIAETNYGHGRFWRDIMAANPGRVFDGGDLIMVGTVLAVPSLDVPEETAPNTGGSCDGGEGVALEPRGECNDWGNFLVYPDEYAGTPPASEEPGVEVVKEAELTALIAERRAAAESDRELALSRVEELLSYAWNDWAITDAEATLAVNLLGNLHFTQIKPAMDSLGGKMRTRLLDNAPSSARATPQFARLVVAMGPAAVQPYVQELLSYGFFDWAITDAEIRAITQVLLLLEPDQQATLYAAMSQTFQTRLLENMHQGAGKTDDQKQLLKTIFDHTADSDIESLKEILGARFNLTVRQAEKSDDERGLEWDVLGLRRIWEILEALPASHVAGNSELDDFARYLGLDEAGNDTALSGTGGYYRGGDHDLVAIDYDPADIDDTQGRSKADPSDPLYGVKRFDKVIRHEVGHAVDDRINAEGTYCTKAAGGEWVKHGTDYDAIATVWLDGTSGAIHDLAKARQDQVKAIVVGCMRARDASTLEADLEALDWWAGLAEDEKTAILADKVVDCLEGSLNSPWKNVDNAKIEVDGRVYQESYSGNWQSYAFEARARKVSKYQFRAGAEWFAEAYSAYYEPDARGDGAKLADADAPSKKWFDSHVHTLESDR